MSSPAQNWARLIGWALVFAGVVGFFYSSAFGSPGETDALFGFFDVNGFHNLVHLGSGALGVVLARSYGSARVFCIALGAIYTLVAIWGFTLNEGEAILSIVPVNTADNLLHAFIAVVSLAVGLAQPSAPAPSSREPGPGIRYN